MQQLSSKMPILARYMHESIHFRTNLSVDQNSASRVCGLDSAAMLRRGWPWLWDSAAEWLGCGVRVLRWRLPFRRGAGAPPSGAVLGRSSPQPSAARWAGRLCVGWSWLDSVLRRDLRATRL